MNRVKSQKASGPLNEKHLQLLNHIIKSCAETEAFCQSCSDCHIDVTPEQAKNREQAEIARRIKARFFPTAQ